MFTVRCWVSFSCTNKVLPSMNVELNRKKFINSGVCVRLLKKKKFMKFFNLTLIIFM
jgi:hypothetical protein